MVRTDSASRVVKALLSRVYDALTDPGALAEWFGGTVRIVAAEAEDRVVQEVEFASGGQGLAAEGTVTWTLARVDGGTRVRLSADDVPPGLSAAEHQQAMASALDGLADYLSRTQTVFRAE